MAFERVYQHAWNVAPSDSSDNSHITASQLFFHHQLMLALLSFTDINNAAIVSPTGAWSVVGSSDGTTGAMDAVDRWGSTFNFAKYVSGTDGNPHSWIVYKCPTSGFGPGCFLLVSMSGSSGFNYITVKFSKSIPTGGSNIYDPSTTDSTASYSNQQINDGTATPFLFSGVLSTIGDHYMFLQKTGQGIAQFFSYLPLMSQQCTSDVFPYGLFMEYNVGGQGAPNNNSFFGTSFWRTRYPDNSGTDGATASSYGPYEPYNPSIGPAASAFAVTGDGQDGSILDWPIFFISSTAATNSNKTRRGRLVDVKVAGADGTAASNGKTDPPSSPPVTPPVTSVVMGTCWFPCNQSPTL